MNRASNSPSLLDRYSNQPDAQCIAHSGNGFKAWVRILSQCFIQRFAGDTGSLGYFGHTTGAGDVDTTAIPAYPVETLKSCGGSRPSAVIAGFFMPRIWPSHGRVDNGDYKTGYAGNTRGGSTRPRVTPGHQLSTGDRFNSELVEAIMPNTAQGASAPVVFNFDTNPVRSMLITDQPWFVASDVCNALGYSDVSMTVRKLDEDERGTSLIGTPSGDQNMLIVNESGLYSLVLRSRKPEARRFKKWITSEVLPTIRKTGGYQIRQPQALPAIDYPMAKWLGMNPWMRHAQNPIPNRDGKGITITASMMFCDDYRSPIRELLDNLANEGINVDACRNELVCLRLLLSDLHHDFQKIQALLSFSLDSKVQLSMGDRS